MIVLNPAPTLMVAITTVIVLSAILAVEHVVAQNGEVGHQFRVLACQYVEADAVDPIFTGSPARRCLPGRWFLETAQYQARLTGPVFAVELRKQRHCRGIRHADGHAGVPRRNALQPQAGFQAFDVA